MLPEQQQHLISLLARAVAGILPEASPDILLERPKVAAHGDVAPHVGEPQAKPAQRHPPAQ
ncbi:arginine--tRNA ligase, partial [Bordetella avium]